jgi:gliding motility-associated-like protein
MRKFNSIVVAIVGLFSFMGSSIHAQTYNIATYHDSTISTCGGAFTDSDAFSNDIYVNNEEYLVTFCSDVPGECIQIDFTNFDIPDAQDWLYVWDGSDTATADFIGQFNNPFGNNDFNITMIYPSGFQSTTGCLTFLFVSDGDFITGTGWDAILTCAAPCPTCYDGIQNGSETDVDCGGVCEPCPEPINIADGGTYNVCDNIFVDSGGLDGDYGDNEDNVVTICSDNPNPNYCLQMTFVQFALSGNDFLYVYDGSSTASPLIATYNNTSVPATIAASGQCITYRFTSNNWGTNSGWVATIDCQECAVEPIPTIADCLGSLSICGNTDTITSVPSGAGNYYDALPINTCGVTDANGVWYLFDVTSAGVLNFNLNSLPVSNNYNWALYNMTGLDCGSLSLATVVSCNSYPTSGPTGISDANGGVGASNTTIPYNENIDVLAGETYALIVSRISASAGFDLDFSASTATISDIYEPIVESLIPSCANNEIEITFSEQVTCSSISGMDFLVVGATTTFNVISVSSDWCDAGLEGGVTFSLVLDGTMNENEAYVLSVTATDGGVEDLCGNVNDLQSFAFNTGLALSLDIDIVPSDCADTQPTGEAAITVVGGLEPFYLEMFGQYAYDDSIFVFTGLPAGSQQVDVYDATGCHAVFIIDIPTSNSNIDNDIVLGNVSCVGNDGTIEVSTQGDIGYGPWNYIISDTAGTILANSNNTDYISITGLAVGEYTVSIEDISGLSPCPDLQFVSIDVPDSILVTTVNDSTICYFGGTSLFGTVVGGTGLPFTLNWDDGVNQYSTIPSQIFSVDSLITTTVFSVYAEDALGCTSEVEQVLITVNDQLSFGVSPDQVICAGSSLVIGVDTIYGGEGVGYEVRWDLGDGLIVIQDSIIVIPSEPTSYCVTISDQCETPDVDSCVVVSPTLYVPVTFSIDSDTASCPPYLASFSNTTDPAFVASAVWSFGDEEGMSGNNSVEHIYTQSGSYNVTLTVTDPDGCVFDTTYFDAITIYPEPVAEFSTNPKAPTLINSTVQFVNESEGDIEWYWVFDTINQLGENFEENPFFVFPDQLPDEYFNRLTVTNVFGCTDYITNMLVIEEDLTLYIPNSFSPNGDGKNDFFYIKSREIDPIFFHLIIFDRWGKVVFETFDINERWNGSINGGEYYSQPGVFIYNLAYKINDTTEKQDVNGTITLLK